MSDGNSENRLDRIVAIIESIAQQQQKFNQGLEDLDRRINSNAKAIEALCENTAEYQRDRDRLYQLMASLATIQAEAHSNMANAIADTRREAYQLMSRQDGQLQILSRRQGEIVEVLKQLAQKSPE